MSFDNQINLVKKINESGELKFFNTQAAFKSMQSNASYDNEAMAINDLIDNSLDANASEVNILLVTGANRTPDDYSLRDSGRKRPDRISAILVQDNGTGMADGFTRAACAYGWSSKKDKKTLGTFGFGVKNAGIAFGSRLEVYSKNKNGKWEFCYIDVNEFTDDKLRELKGEPPQAIEKSPSEKYPFYSEYFENLETGTIIALENLDPAKIKWSTTSNFKKNALQEIATTFYKKAGEISLNFDDGSGVEKVEFIDPLFQTPTLRHYKCKHPVTGRVDNEKVKIFDSATYSVIDKVTKQLRGNVVARFSLMSPTFNHFTKDPSSSIENSKKFQKKDDYNPRNRVMVDHQGIVICRNGRKIFMQNHLPDVNITNNWRQIGMELDFDGSLDEILGLTTQKDKVRFGKEFFDFLREQGFVATIRSIYKERDRLFADHNQKCEKIKSAEDPEKSYDHTQVAAMKAAENPRKKPSDATLKRLKEIGTENLDSHAEKIAIEEGRDKSEVLKDLNKKTKDVPFNVREKHLSRSADFINFVREGSTTWLEFNKDHIYWDKLEGNPTISGDARQYMHFVFYAFYQALITRETINKGEVDKFILDSNFFFNLMKDWSEQLHSLFENLSQVKQSHDEDTSITLEHIIQQRIKDDMYKKKLLKSKKNNQDQSSKTVEDYLEDGSLN